MYLHYEHDSMSYATFREMANNNNNNNNPFRLGVYKFRWFQKSTDTFHAQAAVAPTYLFRYMCVCVSELAREALFKIACDSLK